jgi:hypothetical protein
MDIEKTSSGMQRLNECEKNIAVMNNDVQHYKDDVRDIKCDLKEIFGRLRKMEVRIAVIVSTVTIGLNIIFKVWK